MLTGNPQASEVFFRIIQHADSKQKLSSLLTQPADESDASRSDNQWNRITPLISSITKEMKLNPPVSELQAWLPKVLRFGYRHQN